MRVERVWVGVSLGLLLAATIAAPQSALPKFDVAAVHQWAAGQMPKMYQAKVWREDPGRIVCDYCGLPALLRYAFNLSPSASIEGLPGWAGPVESASSSRYSVDARMPAATTDAQCRLMMQALLQDHFRLAWHWTTRPTPALRMVVAPGGTKLKRPDPPKDKPLPDGTSLICPHGVSGCKFVLPGPMTMAELAAQLPLRIFGRPVVDGTGLSGQFFVPEMILLPPGEPSQAGPSAVTVLRQTTGLELQPATEPLPVLIIDRVYKP